eukprot:855856-Rhodomonas_salina.1
MCDSRDEQPDALIRCARSRIESRVVRHGLDVPALELLRILDTGITQPHSLTRASDPVLRAFAASLDSERPLLEYKSRNVL